MALEECAQTVYQRRGLVDTLYYIWSLEHEAWWRPERNGYTTDVNEAGLYTREQAADITLDVIPPGTEIAVPQGSENMPITGKKP